MSTVTTSSLKTRFERPVERAGDNEFSAFVSKILALKPEIVDFVTQRQGAGKKGTYEGFARGSFNLIFRIAFDDGKPDRLIRFPKPGHTTTALRDEKVVNEVRVMEYLRQNTSIPVPRIYEWGLTAESPHGVGPFIIMECVEGVLLSSILKYPDCEDGDVPGLNPAVDDALMDKIYLQLADYMFQLSRLPFDRIGAISKDEDSVNSWSVTGRPLTYHMNELASCTSYPVDQFCSKPFERASEYLGALAKEHMTHLWTQRNLAETSEIARDRYIARSQFAQLIPKYYADDTGPFLLFCDDMRPSNMIVDPKTHQITAVIDFEYTNALPAQFAQDPPWWLLLDGPETWIDQDAVHEFIALYKPRMEQFLRALERVEERSAARTPPTEQRLSAQMRDSWETGRFWFNYAARKGFEIDGVYWAALHGDSGHAVERLEDEAREEIEKLQRVKMEQLQAYKEDCDALTASED